MTREEPEKKLFAAGSAEEIAELMKAEGREISPEEAAELYEKAGARRADAEDLSLDELESVSGGRDWVTEGCAATVEWDSNCWGTDGGCSLCNIQYQRMPSADDRCPMCGGKVYYATYSVQTADPWWNGYAYKEYICRKCGSYRIKTEDGTVLTSW